ncbi:MAG: hypothetical protein JWN40_2787 [Phycisphaerales bacterium]|nr:hypothetical protein [Phycisphaerales bacterium]
MPRDSIFDPEGTQTEHSGSTFMGPRADQDSHMPPSIVDGKADPEDDLEALEEASDEVEAERQEKLNPDAG